MPGSASSTWEPYCCTSSATNFPAIVDKVQVTLFTGSDDVESLFPQAAAAYQHRDERMGALTDESVDIFYSCALCQSYAPNHVCIITPERLGLCGAYNWLDGKAAYEMNPHGGNLPVKKVEVVDPVLGSGKASRLHPERFQRRVPQVLGLLHDRRPDDLVRLLRVHRLHSSGHPAAS